jgi:DNA-binding transcriptional LysR family regulator
MSANQTPEVLDVRQLQLLDLLYTTRSVTRTAELLEQSQPTVSISLGKLRRRLRDPLFVRTPSGMQPTPRADALIAQAREILESLRRLSQWEPEFAPATAQRRFRICMTDASHITLLPHLLAHVRAVAPHVRFDALRIDGNTALALETGEADLAVGYIPWLESGIYQQTLFPQDWVCLANRRHPRIGKSLTRKAYQEEGHVNILGGTGARVLESALDAARIQRNTTLELPGFLGLGAILSTTDLIATLPRHIGETLAELGHLKVYTCPVSIPTFTVKQHWHARYHNDPGNKWLRGTLATLFLQHTPKGASQSARKQPTSRRSA